MAALQCEFCGGKLITKAGGICECDSCGMEFDKTWVKEKIQEIKGTVKVEGTVQVAGTVKIDGPVEIKGGVNIDSLLKRGWMALEDKSFVEAKHLFDEAMKMDAERSECYFGVLCVSYRQPNMESLLKNEYAQIRTTKTFERAMACADESIRQQIAVLERQFEEDQRAYQVRAAENVQGLEPLRNKILPAQNLVCCTEKVVVAVKPDGTLLTATSGYLDRLEKEWCKELCDQLSKWENIVSVSAHWSKIVGLKSDGTVVAVFRTGDCEDEDLKVSSWRNIVAIAAGYNRTLGVTKTGTIVAVGKQYEPDPLTKETKYDLSGWKNIMDVHCYMDTDAGIRNDGTVVLGGHIWNDKEAKDIGGWKNMISVAPQEYGNGAKNFVGLARDGSIWNRHGKTATENILEIYASDRGVYALDKDGNVLRVRWDGKTEKYLVGENIVALAPQKFDLICLKADGTLVRRTTSGIKEDFAGWKLFENLDTIEQERKQYAEENARKEAEQKAGAYKRAMNLLQYGTRVGDIKKAQEIFVSLKDYQDAQQQRTNCWKKIQEFSMEEQYQKACNLLAKDSIPEVGQAIQEFQKIPDWKDSAEKVKQCLTKIEFLKKRKELNGELSVLYKAKGNLQKELSQLGIFSGKRKKEIAAEIQSLNEKIMEIGKKKEQLK